MKFQYKRGSFRAQGAIWLVALFILSFYSSAYGQEANTHAEDDLEWSRQMQNAPAFVVDYASLKVAAANELNQLGEWSEIIDWPHTAVSAANLPDGRILTYSSNEEDSWPAGQPEFTYAAAWDPATGLFKMVPHNTHDMFCAELVMTDDGKVFVVGGRNHVPTTSIFDFTQDEWSTIDDMNKGRWYPTSVSLPNGDVFTALGSSGGSIPEIWNKDNGWAFTNGIDLQNPIINQDGWTSHTWPYLFVAPNGELFHAGPTPQMHYINLGGNGSVREAGSGDKGWYGKRAFNVMYEENKIMIAGGGAPYGSDFKNDATNAVVSIDISGDTPVLTPLASMNSARVTHNGVLLPNGQIIVVGGRSSGGGDTNSVLTPEIYDPETDTWTQVADMSVPRNYHSTALLMTDGRVWSGGGGFCSNGCPDITHSNAQVYSPPYLFNADGTLATRPEITSAPESVRNNEVFTVNATAGLTRFTLIKMSAITHQMNTDLRRLYANFTETAAGSYEITAHNNPNVLTPGYWMLFGVDANGVPSEAAVVQVTTEGVPQLTNPGLQSSSEGEPVSLSLEATDDDPLAFTATGLPAGLSINGSTGEISGIPVEGSAGLYDVTVTASDAIGGVSVAFQWMITLTQGEVGSVTADQASGTVWHTVSLNNEYVSPVVIMGPPSYGGANQSTMRVRNVTSNSFEFQIDEWDYLDGTHGTETISYMVVEAGIHTLSDGRTLQAGSLTASGNGWNDIFFADAFVNQPVVMSQVGSANDAAAVTARLRNVSLTDFDMQLEEEEGSGNDHGAETVYWVAIESGQQSTDVPNEAGVTGDQVTHEWHTISFSQSYSASPIFLGGFQTTDGGDPATMRYQNLTGGSVEVFAEEEQANDDEIGHTTEIAGFVVFDAAGEIPFEGFELPPIVLATPGDQSGAEGEAVSLTIEVDQDNGNPVTFSASGLPSGVSIDTNSGLISGALVSGDAGTVTVTVDATDGFSSGSTTFTWTIDAARGTWIDYTDDSSTLSVTNDSDEKDIAVGDLNKDGWDDIIVVRKAPFMETEARTDLLLMNEGGTLVDRTETLAPGFAVEPTIARDVVIEDLDGDGWDDVLIANTFGDQPKFYLNLGSDASGWLGLADESTTRLPTLDVGTIQYCGIATGDVNGDGSPDLYFSNYVMDGTTADVLLINDGNGNFTDQGDDLLGELLNTAFGTQASIVDIDQDGDNDIVKLTAESGATPFGDSGVYILYNEGTGNFSNWSSVPSDEPYMFIMEDFDNNGEDDFYIVDDGADYVNLSSGVTVNSNINFTQTITPWARTASNGANLRAGDLDGDGDIDLGVADVDTSFPPCETPGDLRSFLLLENEGAHSGTFIDPFGAADKPWAVNMYDFAFIDVNKDGNLDIFSAQCNGYGLFTSTQEPIDPPPAGDLVVDGDFEAGPVIAETPGWQTYSEGEIIHDVWQVTDGTIDVHYYTMDGSGLGLQPEGGLQHIDLQGDNPGRVIQAIDGLIAGQTYKLSFYYAAYPHSAIVGTAQAKVTIAGLDHTWTATNAGDDAWIAYSGTFVASSTSEELALEGLGSARQWGGVLIDLVEIISCANGGCEIAVPEVNSFTPVSGYVGDAVTITGSNFTGAVSVSFGGTDASIFTVVSDTEITATVPGGASTGVITVATASASGASSTDFEVVDSGSPNLIVQGGFEGDPLAEDGGWISYFEGESLYGVWEVVNGSIDIHHYLHASAGVPIYPDAGLHHIDLQGNEEGVMKQTIGGMTVGQKYRLSFIYAIYPYFAITEASANVQIGLDGNMLNESWTAINPGDELWESGEFVFEATQATADIQFAGYGSARRWGGMLMDQIVLEACSDCTVGASPNMQLTEATSLDLQKELPEEFAIRDAFPNPFNDATDIVFGMPEAGYARMEIYNATGQLIQVLIDGEQRQGYQRIRWEGDDSRGTQVASGVYLIRFEAGGNLQTRKVVVVR